MPSPNMMRIFRTDDGTTQNAYPIRDNYINIAYGECSTVASTAEKVVNIDTTVGWKLRSSSIVIVHFTYSVPASATLNVDDTGAKAVYQNGQALGASVIQAGDTATFVYDGTHYLLVAIDRTGSEINNKLDVSLKGAANGLAELDANGKVPSSQLPSYVDDVIEGYYYNGSFYKENSHTTSIVGETDKIYVDLSTDRSYRWGGSVFVDITGSFVPLSVVDGKICVTYTKEVDD